MASNQSQADVAGTTTTVSEAGPYIVGITGTRGCGKSSVAAILRKQGVPVIDADKLAHVFLNGPCEAYNQVLDRFGHDLVDRKDGPINRAKLAAIVEADRQALCDLEAILHPPVFKLLADKLSALAGEPIIGVELPLLHEKNLKHLFDQVWCVVVREDILLARLLANRGTSEERARHQLSMQLPQVQKSRLSDVTFNNSGTEEELEVKVLEQLEVVRQLASDPNRIPRDGEPPVDDETDGEPTDSNPPADDNADDGTTSDDDRDDSDSPLEPNEHYRRRLRQFAEIGTDAALERMGNVGTTGHKTASATMSMRVGSDTDGDPARDMKVTVSMEMRNANAGNGDGGCSCGCGPECRVSCACAPDCGCGCKKPTPPPPPVDGDNGKPHGRRWDRPLIVLGVVALVCALLGFLAFLYASKAKSEHTHVPDVVKVELVNPPSCLPGCGGEKPKDDGIVIKPEPPKDDGGSVVVVPGDSCSKAGTFRQVAEMPGYSFRFTLNAVRPRIATWHEKQLVDCTGWVVEGREADGRMVVHQVFDANYWLKHQLVFTYHKDRSIQVDRYDGVQNQFVGRAIFEVNQDGNITVARLYDGLQRHVSTTSLSYGYGAVDSVTTTSYDAATGVQKGIKTISNPSEATAFLARIYYGYTWFARP